MSHIFQQIDDAIMERTRGILNINEWIANGTKQEFLNSFTVLKDSYEQSIVWEFSEKEGRMFIELIKSGDASGAYKFGEKYGKKLPDELARKFDSMVLMQCLNAEHQARMLADDFYYSCLKSDFYRSNEEFLNELIRNASNRIIAKKPRNKAHSEAVTIARLTRGKYPGASFGGMCNELFKYYEKEHKKDKNNQAVSLDSLQRWLKKAGIKPISKKDSTSFSLVFPEGA